MIEIKELSPKERVIRDAEARVFSDAWSDTALASHETSFGARTIAAYLDGVFAGYLLGTVNPPEGEVYRVAVLPEFRQRGIGERLLCAFLVDVPVCFLEVRESNLAARALYEKQGFTLVGVRKKYYKNPMEDACIYKREKV